MTIEQIPETWRKTKDRDVIRIWSNQVTYVIAHILKYPGQNAVTDLIVAAPETARQRDELLEALREAVKCLDRASYPEGGYTDQTTKRCQAVIANAEKNL